MAYYKVCLAIQSFTNNAHTPSTTDCPNLLYIMPRPGRKRHVELPPPSEETDLTTEGIQVPPVYMHILMYTRLKAAADDSADTLPSAGRSTAALDIAHFFTPRDTPDPEDKPQQCLICRFVIFFFYNWPD